MATTKKKTKTAFRIPLCVEPQPEGGYTVTCPLIPEFLTEGYSLDEIMENVLDLWPMIVEFYEKEGLPLPAELLELGRDEPFTLDVLIPGLGTAIGVATTKKNKKRAIRLPLWMEPQPEGVYTVTCPLIPEFLTEGDDLEDVLAQVEDLWPLIEEHYEEERMALPAEIYELGKDGPVNVDALIQFHEKETAMAARKKAKRAIRIPLCLEPQPEGGYTITCPIIPEFLTEADNLDQVVAHVKDLWPLIEETYEERRIALPDDLFALDCAIPTTIDVLIQV